MFEQTRFDMSDSWKKFFEIDEEVNSFKFPKSKGFRTKAIHVGQEPGQWSSKSVVPPIHVSATYAMEDQKNYVSVGQSSHKVNYT